MTIRNLSSRTPEKDRESFERVIQNDGVMLAEECQKFCETHNESLETLMLKLLPLAADYSVANISNFNVGAVVCGKQQNRKGYSNLYLGANFEFDHLALGNSLHAEQAAATNAWMHNDSIKSLATSAAPCGHCRQFLYESSCGDSLPILIPQPESSIAQSNADYQAIELNTLLPAAFGPADLGSQEKLMSNNNQGINLSFAKGVNDSLVDLARLTAEQSYAPYTKNFAGCVILAEDNETYLGRYAENVAFNPSLLAFTAALSQMRMARKAFSSNRIKRVIIVEHDTQTSQRSASELLLGSLNSRVRLEWHAATLE
ncbi:cytidine deaminase [Aliikangiella marina]|uniref:Cytidine deaminase n=1 Tax=Aliikangiella marina TaxID=1712262 RepID=A0A545THM9_9GAMM|nr:cytidine deaminase [Aliikangiella marina]TQV76737.1 cytidine deaminase [Aliikangiella marina]